MLPCKSSTLTFTPLSAAWSATSSNRADGLRPGILAAEQDVQRRVVVAVAEQRAHRLRPEVRGGVDGLLEACYAGLAVEAARRDEGRVRPDVAELQSELA